MNMKDRLIVAMDVPDADSAWRLADSLGDAVDIYKIGFQLFTAYGPDMVREFCRRGKKVFLDLKFHDIPNTVASGVRSAVGLSVGSRDCIGGGCKDRAGYVPLFMLTVHAQGGGEMMEAAACAARERAQELQVMRPLVVGVTVLTSDAAGEQTEGLVLSRAQAARAAGLDGVVASAREAGMLRRELGEDFVIVTPGIRPADMEAGDQKRVETPQSAVRAGASFLVVGRPIVQAKDPRGAALSILDQMARGR